MAFERNTIKCYDEFQIEWEVSKDNEDWESIGVSTNVLYVTHDRPIQEAIPARIPFPWTVVNISCHMAGGLDGDGEEVMSAIYSGAFRKNIQGQFKGTKRVSDDHALTYYANLPPKEECPADLLEMIRVGDGRCGTWAYFLKACMDVQGIQGAEVVAVFPSGPSAGASSIWTDQELADIVRIIENKKPEALAIEIPNRQKVFLVKNWMDVSPGKLIHLEDADGQPNTTDLRGYETAKSDKGESGIVEQGVPSIEDPRSIFANHAVVFFKNKTYDPSYGTKYPNSHARGIGQFKDSSLLASEGVIVYVRTHELKHEWYYYVHSTSNALQFSVQ